MRTTIRYRAVCQTQSCGHYIVSESCAHKHRSEDAALACARRWERREQRISRDNIGAGLAVSNGARYLTRMIDG